MDLACIERGDEAARAEAHDMELGDADPRPGEQPAEPRVLGRPGRCDADTEPGQVLHRAHLGGVRGADDEGAGRRGRQPEDQARMLARLAGAEAEHRLERGRHEVRLSLGERLGRARLGARRSQPHVEPLAGEVALGGRHAQRQILR